MIGTKESANGAAQVEREPVAAVRTIPDSVRQDYLTKRPTGVRAWSTGAFTGASVTVLVASVPQNRVRVRQIVFLMTENAAIAGGAQEVTLKLRDNQNPTGLECSFYVPLGSVAGLGVEVVGPWDLGEGYVSAKGTTLDVTADFTLTSGHFRVIIFGNEEAGN